MEPSLRHAASSEKITTFALYADVIIEGGLDTTLEYGVSEDLALDLEEGMRVSVPVRGSIREGIVFHIKEFSSFKKVLPIASILEKDWISKDLLKLLSWMHEYYAAPYRKLFKLFTPSSIRSKVKDKLVTLISLKKTKSETLSIAAEIASKHPSQSKILESLLKSEKPLLEQELLTEAKVSKAPLASLLKKKLITIEKRKVDRSIIYDSPHFQTKPKQLNDEQKTAYDKIITSLEKNEHKTHLIHGVTGSGKTEVYMQAIAKVREKGHSALMLVPEIALTTQMIERFKSRFTEPIAIYHHRLSDGEKADMWEKLKKGEMQIMLGARSAVFCPLKDLKLIIVDEEHESSYKQQEETPCYSAKDVAIMRAYLIQATVVLGSATPSIESYYKAKKGKYELTNLQNRASSANLPKVELINMLSENEKSQRGCMLSNKLLSAIKKRIGLGEQVMLFLNRRGYNNFLLCAGCSSPIQCPHCDVSLTYHKKENHLKCHYCSHIICPPPKECPSCKKPTLEYKGIGTEQVESILNRVFPQIRTLRMDADTTSKKGSHEKLYKMFKSGKADVLIGTQMIAKGFHFPSVTLVGVLNADAGLNIPHFRAEENLFQLIAQVAGRAGRGPLAGEVYIQTYLVDHELFSFLKKEDYKGFYEREIKVRKLFVYPPFTHLAKLVFKGPDPEKTKFFAELYHKELVKSLGINYLIMPVIEEGIFKIKDRYHFTLHLKGPSMKEVSRAILNIEAKYPLKTPYTLLIDIDA